MPIQARFGEQFHLAASTGKVHHEVGHSLAGYGFTQILHQGQGLFNGDPEMGGAGNPVQLVQIIRFYSNFQQPMEEAVKGIGVSAVTATKPAGTSVTCRAVSTGLPLGRISSSSGESPWRMPIANFCPR